MVKASEQQAIKLVALLVEHHKYLTGAPTEQVQWAIQNPVAAVSLFCSALESRTGRFMICVDRSKTPPYPEWVQEAVHPELQGVGPTEYDVADLDQWVTRDPNCLVRGRLTYEYLKESKMLETCLCLTDLLEIQAKGIQCFLACAKGATCLVALRSVCKGKDSKMYVAYLTLHDCAVILRWACIDKCVFDRVHSIPRFRSN